MRRLICLALLLCICTTAMAEMPEWTYPVSLESLTSGYVVLANKDVLLGKDYVPDDLVKLTCKKTSGTAIEMRQAASDAMNRMFEDAKQENIILYVHSGYRSYQTQKTMYYNRLEKNNGRDDGLVQAAGASDHQTGLGADVIGKAWIGKSFNGKFADCKEGQWMAEHCWDYGFIIRYQEDKEELTGIEFEPWHLRYVGEEASLYMRENHLCLEEFTEEWQAALTEWESRGGVTDAYIREQAVRREQERIAENGPDGEVGLGIYGEDGDEEVYLFH